MEASSSFFGFRPRVFIKLAILSLLISWNVAATCGLVAERKQIISPHTWQVVSKAAGPCAKDGPCPQTPLSYGIKASQEEGNLADYGQSLVQTGRERTKLVGLLEHEQMLAYSQNLQHAFKKYSKFIHSVRFLRELFSQNPFLKFVTVPYRDRVKIVDALEAVTKRWTPMPKDKAVAAEQVMASFVLRNMYTLRKSLLNRTVYIEVRKKILAALRDVNAGGHAMDMILANKGKPLFSWMLSLWRNPLATLSNVVSAAFEETFEGIMGLPTAEVKSACFSFGYRVNSIAPYTAVLPGGVFGSVLRSLSRSFMLVFYPAYASFRGIFSLMIGVICKTGILTAAKNLFKAIANFTRLGLRGIRILMRRFAVRGDPVAWPILQDLLRNASPAMITLLFQLYAVDVQGITQKGKLVAQALAAGSASWNYADGLWVGAFDFGRAFFNTIRSYKSGAEAFVGYCESKAMESQPAAPEEQAMIDLISDESTAAGSDAGTNESISESEGPGDASEEPPREDIMAAFKAIAPDAQVPPGEARTRLDAACRKYRKFVTSYRKDPVKHVESVAKQVVKVLKYDYKFFQSYVGEMMSVFYDTAYVLLNADVANVLNEKLPLESAGDQIQTAMAAFQRYREAAAESAAGLAVHFVIEDMGDDTLRGRRDAAAFSLLRMGSQKLRRAVNSLYGHFLESRIMISRLEGNKSIKTVQDFLSKCNPRLGVPDADVCGKVVTGEVDANLFVKEALFATHLPMAVAPNDIAALDEASVGDVFARWRESSKLSRDDQIVAEGASDRASMKTFLEYFRRSIIGRLVFIRFDFTEDFTSLVLHDSNGRSLTFKPDNADDVRALSGRQETASTTFRPSPLSTSCWFHLDEGNKGTLQFPIVSETAAIEGLEPATGAGALAEGIPVHKIPGQIQYNDRREELASIQQDPSAVREVIVAKFLDVHGRASAEMVRLRTTISRYMKILMATLLILIHSKVESFWSHSPSVFMQNITPKMFFDALQALSATAKTRPATSVMLEGRLYTFPLNFSTVKTILLGAMNRLIVRMHSLDSKDVVSVFMMTAAYLAYQKIQKHRTGKTLVMNQFQRDVLHLALAQRRGALLTEAPHCAWLEEEGLNIDKFIVMCSTLRFFKVGSVDNIEESDKGAVRNYIKAFVNILDGVRGSTSWMDFLNVRAFAAEADLFAKTAAKYSYDKLLQELRVEYAGAEKGEGLSKLYTEIHPALGGPKRYSKDRRDLATALRSYAENIKKLPESLRKSMKTFVDSCYGRFRWLVGAKQFALFKKLRPNVLHGTTFFAAVQGAEGQAFPNPELRRGLLIEALDLNEYARLQLALEELAMILSDSHSMQNVVAELRSVPVQTIEAREEYKKLKSRIEALPVETVEAAAGWSLRYLSEGKGGMELAVAMLSLKSPEARQLSNALQLSFASVEVLAFLNGALSVAQVVEFLERATPEDLAHLRISLGAFKASAQTEPRSTAMSLKTKYSVVQSISNTLESLELLQPQLEGRTMLEMCSGLLRESPQALFRGSLVSASMEDIVVMCYILSELVSFQQVKEDEITAGDLVERTRVDGKPVMTYLKDLINTSIKPETRLITANIVSPFLRGLLIAFLGQEVGHLAAAQFAAVDLTTGILTFVITSSIDFSSADPVNPLKPADVLRKVARLALGAETPTEGGAPKIVAATVSYPQCLGDWYALADFAKLEELTMNPASLTGEALANASASNRFVDITDFFFSLRQSSPVQPQVMVAKAREILMSNEKLPLLERVGLGVFITGLLKLAEQAKTDCLQEAMKDIAGYLPLTLQEQHLYKSDCFVKKFSDGAAGPEAAKNITNEQLSEAFDAIETAYATKASELFNLILSEADKLPRALDRGFEFLLHAPVLPFGRRVAEEVISAIAQRSSWDTLSDRLLLLKEVRWSLPDKTPLRKRVLDQETHPKFFNIIQIAVDILEFMRTGLFERRRIPKLLLLKRIAAAAKMIVKRLRPTSKGQDRAIRQLAAQKLREELSGLVPSPEAGGGPIAPAEEESGASEPLIPAE
ncbi:hypothetical protein, conserved [Eimeria brunetti]|uniref:Rhoptry neck protein n=1 Tax=Eimeria brunetti TaxID=51314 RepID=U6LCF9_9EIME|nr:hypothetical protein, conserved [Eimeria brunetti]